MKIRNRFLVTTLAVTLIILTGSTLGLSQWLKSTELHSLDHRIEQSESVLADVLTLPLWSVDEVQVRNICESFFEDPELIELRITNVPASLNTQLEKKPEGLLNGNRISRELNLVFEAVKIGTIELTYTTALIEEKLLRLRTWMVSIAVVISIVLILIFGRLSAAITAPIDRLIFALRKVDNGNYHDDLRMEGHGEFLALEQYFNNMLTTLQSNKEHHANFTEEIQKKNLDLEEEIQQRKRAEAALHHAQKLEAIGRIAGGVAHDFNNLLTAILGYTELAELDLPEDHATRASIREIRTAGERGRDLIEQLLAVGRKKPITPESLPVRETLDGIRLLIEKTLVSGIQLNVNTVSTDKDLTMVTDQSALSQILLNLAGNARDAMPNGGTVDIHVRCVRATPSTELQVPEAGQYVRIDVRDSGQGIPEDKLSQIFEPFYSTKGDKGTGLGLAMVHSLVLQLHGAVRVQSELGVGTTVSLYFPKGLHAVPRVPKEPLEAPVHREGAILLVEDETQVRELLRMGLERLGYTVTPHEDGTDGLAALESPDAAYDLIISDVLMKRLDGPEMIHAAKEKNLLHCPVLFITGYGHELLGDLLEAPDIFLLHKPFSRSDLSQVMNEILQEPTEPIA